MEGYGGLHLTKTNQSRGASNMEGVNFTFSETEDGFDKMIALIQNIYLESDSWDFKVEITKEQGTYNVWIGDKDE